MIDINWEKSAIHVDNFCEEINNIRSTKMDLYLYRWPAHNGWLSH